MKKPFIKSTFVSTSQGKIHTLFSGTSERQVIFLHGWNNDAWSAKRVLSKLSQKYSVIAPTLPGSHPSLALNGKGTIEQIASILAEWLDQVVSRDGATIIGHSFGGLCALAVAQLREPKITQIIICNSAGVPITKHSAHWVSQWSGHRPTLYRRYGLAVVRMLDRSLIKQCILRFSDFTSLAFMAKHTDIRKFRKQLTIPITIAWGIDDTFMEFSQAEALRDSLPSSKIVSMPGDHYWPVMEPERFFTLIRGN